MVPALPRANGAEGVVNSGGSIRRGQCGAVDGVNSAGLIPPQMFEQGGGQPRPAG